MNSATSRIKRNFSNPVPASPPIPKPEAADSDGALELLKTIEPKMVAGLLKNEHPQTLALILANIKEPDQTARILKELSPEVQADISYRMATLEPVPPGVIDEIESVLSSELKAYEAASAGVLGGIESVAEILSSMDTLTEARILATIEESNPELAEQIRELMFTLEDLVLINTKGMQAVLKEIPQKELVLTLKTASDSVKEHIFNSMSKRAADMVKADLEAVGPVKVVDVETARQKLVKIARQLEAEGKIIINGAVQPEAKKKPEKKT